MVFLYAYQIFFVEERVGKTSAAYLSEHRLIAYNRMRGDRLTQLPRLHWFG